MAALTYRVHGATPGKATVMASVAGGDGEQVEVEVPALLVEMVSLDGSMGHTFRFVRPDEALLADVQSAIDENRGVSVEFNFGG